MEKRDFEQILKDATRDVLVEMYRDDVVREIIDSDSPCEETYSIDISVRRRRENIDKIRCLKNQYLRVFEQFGEEGLI